ncbi:predicted protein [Histoplasma mississippiense (nom. inval.)]|nr:predicted protein [Histoplasma mississippiense (nom. inval.)]EDN06373.1 predicted protein [Histoplasma mississippiense (nom. inval.)]
MPLDDSITGSPQQDIVTMHIRTNGPWKKCK